MNSKKIKSYKKNIIYKIDPEIEKKEEDLKKNIQICDFRRFLPATTFIQNNTDFSEFFKLKYRRRKNDIKPALHWGQRKLFLSEIEFLNLFGKKSEYFIYIGAADGKHIKNLSELFPDIHFILYDPRDFDPDLVIYTKQTDKVEIRQQFFTDKDIEQFKQAPYKDNVLIVSDIRNIPEGFKLGSQNEYAADDISEQMDENVVEDMKRQMNWCAAIRPVASMLKFRLPYTPGQTEYLGGDVYFQTWAGETSSETRLITSNFDERVVYDHEKYENACFYLNRCFREHDFSHYMPDDIKQYYEFNNYDVLSECDILNKYIQINNPSFNLGQFINNINNELGYTMEKKYKFKNEKN